VGTRQGLAPERPQSNVSIQLGSPASGDLDLFLQLPRLCPCFHSIGFPSEWGPPLTSRRPARRATCFHSIGFPSEWGPCLLKPVSSALSRGCLRALTNQAVFAAPVASMQRLQSPTASRREGDNETLGLSGINKIPRGATKTENPIGLNHHRSRCFHHRHPPPNLHLGQGVARQWI
jgi:hypothetical protein